MIVEENFINGQNAVFYRSKRSLKMQQTKQLMADADESQVVSEFPHYPVTSKRLYLNISSLYLKFWI